MQQALMLVLKVELITKACQYVVLEGHVVNHFNDIIFLPYD